MWEGGECIAVAPPAGISTGASKVELDKDCFFFPSTFMLGFRGRASDLKKEKKQYYYKAHAKKKKKNLNRDR